MDDGEDFPKAAVQGLLRQGLEGTRMSKELVGTVQEVCKEFVHLIAAEATSVAAAKKHKMLTPEHILAAIERLEFASLVGELRTFAAEFKEEKETRKKKKRAKASGMSPEEAAALQQQLFAAAKANGVGGAGPSGGGGGA